MPEMNSSELPSCEGLWPYIIILLSTLAMWTYDLYRRGRRAFNQLRFEMLFTPL